MIEKFTKEEQMQTLVKKISAYIEQYHGGSAELVNFEDNIATIKLGGACEECNRSASTLHGWVQGTIHQFFPEVKVVAAEE